MSSEPMSSTSNVHDDEGLRQRIEELQARCDRQQRILDAILLQSPYGLMLADSDGRFLVENEASKAIWAGAVDPSNLEEWRAYRAFHPDGTPFQPGDWGMAQALSTGNVVAPREIRILRFDGTPGVLLGSAAPIVGPDGATDGALSVFADITQLKEQEHALRLSSERYLATLKCIGDAVIATDGTGGIQFMNQVAIELTGWTLAEAQGRDLDEVCVLSGGDPGALQGELLEVPTIEGPTSAVLVSRTQHEVPVELTGAPIFDADGSHAGIVVVFRDVGKRRREAARRRLLAEASTVLSASLDYQQTLKSVCALAVTAIADWCAVDIVDADGNLRRLLLHHLDPDKRALADRFLQRYPLDPWGLEGVEDVVRSGRPRMARATLAMFNTVDVEHRAFLQELGVGAYLIVPLMARDRTLGAITLVSSNPAAEFDEDDLAAAEELGRVAGFAIDNARLYGEANRANGAKDQFLAVVSHELRTPLNAVLGWAQLLRRSGLSDEQRESGLEVIERNARIQAQLVDDLLDVSRIASGKLRLDVTPFDLGRLVREVVQGEIPAALARGIALTAKVDGVHPVLGDVGRLNQVLSNLLSNAFKFTPSGGEVEVSLVAEGDFEVLRVRDSGLGIEQRSLGDVFDRFQQLSDGNERIHGGLGLGLAIVRSLVQLHGGSVQAQSEGLGLGSTFEVQLPAGSTIEPDPSPREPGQHALFGVRVLVVEDMVDTRELVAVLLRSRGAEVETAASGFEALAAVEKRRPDLLVSDIAMPGMDGHTLMRRLRELDPDRPIPAVALTAFASAEDRTQALEAGFRAHLSKPVDTEALVALLCRLRPGASAAR